MVHSSSDSWDTALFPFARRRRGWLRGVRTLPCPRPLRPEPPISGFPWPTMGCMLKTGSLLDCLASNDPGRLKYHHPRRRKPMATITMLEQSVASKPPVHSPDSRQDITTTETSNVASADLVSKPSDATLDVSVVVE